MSKVTLTTLANLQNETTATNAINANSATITTAFDNTLSRDGTAPNQMAANLDMNSFHVLNLPNPSTANEPLRFQDLSDFLNGGTVTNLPAGGSTLDVLAKTSNTDYAVGWNTHTGTGNIVYSTSPTLVTPTLGVASATTINKLTITAPATSATLTIVNGKTLTSNNTLTLAGTDSTTLTFQGTDTYVGRATTDTLTNKTYDTAATGNSFSINGLAATANTGTGAVVRASGASITGIASLTTAAGVGAVFGASSGSPQVSVLGGNTGNLGGFITVGDSGTQHSFGIERVIVGNGLANFAAYTSGTNSFNIWTSNLVRLSVAPTTGLISITNGLIPSLSDGAVLGSTSFQWSDLFLASGGVINWNSGDVTISHASNLLAFGGANFYTFDNVLIPLTNDGASLGNTTFQFSDLFLASGGVINWNNGTYTFTQSSTNLAHSGSISVGANSGTNGSVKLFGSTSGDCTIKTAAVAGTATNFQLPITNGGAGTFLQSDGAGNTSWVTGSGAVTSGNRVLLATLTASSSASLADTTSLTSTYDSYLLVFEGILPATNSVACRLRVNSGGVQTTSYLANLITRTSAVDETTFIPIATSGASLLASNTGPGIYAQAFVYQPSGTSAPKMVSATGSYLNSSSNISNFVSGGYWNGGNGAVTGIEITMSSGNIASGTVKIYGIVN